MIYESMNHAVESSILFFQAPITSYVDDVARPQESESHEMNFFFLCRDIFDGP